MNNVKKVSIIVPIYNREKTLDNCIKSLISQTYKNIEILLVDDGSTDDSSTICLKYQSEDKRIKYIYQKNKGISSARNMGLKKAQGNYIAFVDSDDYIECNMIEILLNIMLEHKCDLTICNYNVVNGYNQYKNVHNNISITKVTKNEVIKGILNETEYGGICWNKMYKKEIIKSNVFDNNIEIGEDLDFVLRIIEKCDNIIYTNAKLYYYVLASQNITKQDYYKNIEKWNTEIELCERIIKKYTNSEMEIYAKKRFCRVNTSIYLNLKKKHKSTSLAYRDNSLRFFYEIIFSNEISLKFKIKLFLIKMRIL